MKAMVLAAGLGLRMRPLTALRAKPALPVLNRPLILWTLERLARHGVTDVLINTHHLSATVRKAVAPARALGLRIIFSHERRILGTGGGPRHVRDFFGSAPFLLVNGDVWFDFDLAALVKSHRASGALATLALKPNLEPAVYGSIVTGSDGRIRSLAGLPQPARGRVSLFTGIHVVDPAILDRLPAGPSDSVRDLYVPLVAEGALLSGVRVRGPWQDLGTPTLYRRAQVKLLGLAGRSRIHPTARVDPRARVIRSVVGPGCLVGPGARVTESILWDDVAVDAGARVAASILASGVRAKAGAPVAGRIGVRRPRGETWSKL